MELSSSSLYILCVLFFLSLFNYRSHCQQVYANISRLDCSDNASLSRGYLCNGPLKSCNSFVTYRANSPYDTPVSIAYLLGSEALNISAANNISSVAKIASGKLVIVPISCSCFGSIYQHYATYTVQAGDTYYLLANDTYEGLTTCQAIKGQNYYDPENIPVDVELTVPIRCACPTENQTAEGITSLITYTVVSGESVSSIGQQFGADVQDIIEANTLSRDGDISPFTPLLIPLKGENCSVNSFFCYCSDGYTDRSLGCRPVAKRFPVKLVTLLGVCIGAGLLCLFLIGFQLYRWIKKRREKILKEKLFKQNGGLLLQQKFSSNGSNEKAKLFTAEEMRRATDNYNQSRFLGQGGYGTVYKGMLPDGSIVAIKRSKEIDQNRIQQFINEVVVLSQVNHRNIVKLLGCCLETEVPLLVYEFISNGTLSHHIHNQEPGSTLSWDNRFRIACEVAGALAYMHSAASIPVFHRDIKSSNILLDEKYNPKVSDFGTSRSIPNDKTHLTTDVQGTFGYLDPEYFQSSQFTDKSDVYSFGVVLVELLTGEKPISFFRAEEDRNLVAYFISSTKENKLFEIIDTVVSKGARREDIVVIAKLTMRCLKLNGKKRPTMKEVALELEGLRKSQRCLQVDEKASFQDSVSEISQEVMEEIAPFSLETESVTI